MARYFLHLRSGTDDILEEEGSLFSTIAVVKKAVLAGAREHWRKFATLILSICVTVSTR